MNAWRMVRLMVGLSFSRSAGVPRQVVASLVIQAALAELPQPPEPKENFMAVQQNKKSPSKRGMHRSHNALVTPGTAVEPTTGEVHLRHHISPNGFYRGRKVLKTKADA